MYLVIAILSLLSFTSTTLSATIEVQGELTLGYWIESTIGEPPKKFRLKLDSTSTDLLLLGNECSGCPARTSRIDLSQTSTSYIVPCNDTQFTCGQISYCVKYNSTESGCGFAMDFFYNDIDAHVEGFMFKDTINFGDFILNDIPMGYINFASDAFNNEGVDGILGISYSEVSAWGGPSIIHQLLERLNYPNEYKLCLRRRGGTIEINEEGYSNKDAVSVGIEGSEFTVSIEKIYVGDKIVDLTIEEFNGELGSSIISTGETEMWFPDVVVDTILEKMKEYCDKYNIKGICDQGSKLFEGNCYDWSDDDLLQFPTLTISLKNVNLTLLPHDYLVIRNGFHCLGISKGTKNSRSVLGRTFLQRFCIVLDDENNTISFNCNDNCGDKRASCNEECDSVEGCSSTCKCLPGWKPTGEGICEKIDTDFDFPSKSTPFTATESALIFGIVLLIGISIFLFGFSYYLHLEHRKSQTRN